MSDDAEGGGRGTPGDQGDGESSAEVMSEPRISRRRLLGLGLGGAAVVVIGGAIGLELVNHDVLPGKQFLDSVDGACSVASPPLEFAPLGPSISGTFYSHARNRTVGYTIGFPPGHQPGDSLPLVVMLHGFGANHTNALAGMSPAQAVALKVDGRPLAPMALVTVDGGGGYWNPHPDDNPMAMVMDELIPMCQRMGLGASRTKSARWESQWVATVPSSWPRSSPSRFEQWQRSARPCGPPTARQRPRIPAPMRQLPTLTVATQLPMRQHLQTLQSGSPRAMMIHSTPGLPPWLPPCLRVPPSSSRRAAIRGRSSSSKSPHR